MRFYLFAATITLFSLSTVAHADSFTTDHFDIVGQGIEDTFDLPATPAVSASGTYGFSIGQVPVRENGTDASRQIFFFSGDLGGGLLISNNGGSDVNPFGTQLYSGANESPTFLLGTFPLSGIGSYTVTVTEAATAPEPGSCLLLAVGLLAVWRFTKRGANKQSFVA